MCVDKKVIKYTYIGIISFFWIVNDVHDEEKHMLQEWGLLNSKKQLGSVNREIRKMAKQKYLKMIQKEEVLKFYRS